MLSTKRIILTRIQRRGRGGLWCADDFLSTFQRHEIDESLVRGRIARIEKSEGIELDPQQKKAILEAARCGLVVITGGPGTGKTTTINTMITYFEQEGLEIELAAPTGRAAKRMTEATGLTSFTLHRLLKWDPATRKFVFGRGNQLPYDLFVLDETSMLDILLALAFFRAVKPGARLILIGEIVVQVCTVGIDVLVGKRMSRTAVIVYE